MIVRSLGYRTDLGLLRLGGASIEDRGDHLVVRSPHNPTHWWGNFLLLDSVPAATSSESWLARFSEAFPGAGHVAIGFDGTGGSVHDLAWFNDRGIPAEASTVMTASAVIKAARPNPEVECRPLRSDGDWEQSVDLRMRCNERELEPADYRRFVVAAARCNRVLVDAGHGAWFGAFVGERLVAQMGLLLTEVGTARFRSVETDPGHRRRGIARALLHHASRFGFERLSARTLVMVADPDYVAIDLYRSVGFTATEVQLQVERAPCPAGSMDDPAPPEPPEDDPGGDDACWLDRVCPECGAMRDADPPAACPRCGSEVGPA